MAASDRLVRQNDADDAEQPVVCHRSHDKDDDKQTRQRPVPNVALVRSLSNEVSRYIDRGHKTFVMDSGGDLVTNGYYLDVQSAESITDALQEVVVHTYLCILFEQTDFGSHITVVLTAPTERELEIAKRLAANPNQIKAINALQSKRS